VKTPAILIAILAILIGIVPYFFNCQYDGKALTLANGRQVPMKCYWTAQAALVVAVPLLVVGVMMAFSQRRETMRALTILGAILGLFAILLPTQLIGVCQHAGASCNLVMKPALIFMGVLVISISLVSLLISERRAELIP
jgi:ABC-type sulfate transport system permease component